MKQFPVGIYQFSPNKMINFELNRWHSFGFAPEGRVENAAIYYRAAEFFLPGEHPEKMPNGWMQFEANIFQSAP